MNKYIIAMNVFGTDIYMSRFGTCKTRSSALRFKSEKSARVYIDLMVSDFDLDQKFADLCSVEPENGPDEDEMIAEHDRLIRAAIQ